jgi:hypothetical protein
MSRTLAKWMIVVGAGLALFGVAAAFWLEWQMEVRYIPWAQFYYLQFVSPYALVIGLPTAIIGSFMWARREASAKTLNILGCVILACVLLGLIITPMLTEINIHNWAVTLALVYAAAFLISMIFLGFALYRQL